MLTNLLTTSLLLLTCLNIVATYLLARQVGRILRRFPHTGARMDGSGPRAGEDLTQFIAAIRRQFYLRNEGKGRIFVLFTSDACSVCKVVLQDLRGIIAHWPEYHFVLCADDEGRTLEPFAGMENVAIIKEAIEARESLALPFVPAGLTIADGRAVAAGLVNAGEHVESLLESQPTKVSP